MRTFSCRNCGHALFFESTSCVRCHSPAGVVDGLRTVALRGTDGPHDDRPIDDGSGDDTTFAPIGATRTLRCCSNARHGACNWMVDADGPDAFCLACRHNLVIPDLSEPSNLAAWKRMEVAKHRLIYMLLRLGLPLFTRTDDPDEGLGFEFKADMPGAAKVMTGHANGLITIDLAEADDAEREKRRAAMGEPYRTLIGHFRHEVGHWYWDRLARDGDEATLARVRETFGDDREDYGAALQRHYEQGPPADWPERFVSSYATAHPWEDFAETWAHYLHIVDTLDTAAGYGMRVAAPGDGDAGEIGQGVDFDPYAEPSVDRILDAWNPLTVALNSINRSMGLPDLYPFVITPPIRAKLAVVHDLVRGAGGTQPRP